MNYRRLGKWGVQVSEVSLGSWLTFGGTVEESTAIECIRFAYENGINFFDTANVYSAGKAEEVVGKALREYPRDHYVLATKVFFPMGDKPNLRGLSRKHVFEQCHASLRRLNMEYVDLYQCHRPDRNVPLEETIRAMDDLVRQGKILYWGISEWSAAQIVDAVRLCERMNAPKPVSNQPIYNMLTRYIEKEVVPVSEREGLGQIVFSPLAQGILTGKYRAGQPPPSDSRAADPNENMFMGALLEEQNLNRVERLRPIAERHGLTLAQLALAWCLRLPSISSVIVGATRVSQIQENIGASGVTLPPETLEAIEEILK